jgi:tetratricopeptide (TPR) repeat protein
MSGPRHLWIAAASQAERAALVDAQVLPPRVVPEVDAHRNRRGPYTAGGTIVRSVAPVVLRRWPDLAGAHSTEILTMAPELREEIPAPPEDLTSLAKGAERTRTHSRMRTWRLAHGFTEFLRDYQLKLGEGTGSLVVCNVDAADPTDAELLAILLRRIDPALLTLVVCTGNEVKHPMLAAALTAHATKVRGVTVAGPAALHGADAELAAGYVNSDCTDDRPELIAAYQRLPQDTRARLHDERAAALVALGEFSLSLGALPLHRERGGNPAQMGAAALQMAVNHCFEMGFYEAVVGLARRGREVIDEAREAELWWLFTKRLGHSLAALDRPGEADETYQEALAHSDSPVVHMTAAYEVAMLYTRYYEPGRKDHTKAKKLLNQAIAFASVTFDGPERAFHVAFNHNALALAEVHLGNLAEARRLVTVGIELLDRELTPSEHRLHRSVLHRNRAQALAGLGRLEEALTDYATAIAMDPNYEAYYFERAAILNRLDRDDEAISDYNRAIELGLPYTEFHYNRAELLLALGATDQAVADLDYVLELDPEHTDAYINRASIRLAAGDLDTAFDDATAGLRSAPDDPQLHTVLGNVAAERGDAASANVAFERALASDSRMSPALAGRARLSFELGDVDAALADLCAAIDAAPDDPELRYNRAFAYEHLQRWDAALADLDIAAKLDPDDPDIRSAQRRCAAGTDSEIPT